MRQLTTLLIGLSLLGGVGLGCGQPAPDPEPDVHTAGVLDQVKLTPAHQATQLREGEYFTYDAVAADGHRLRYRYEVRDGGLVAINGGPELTVLEAQNLGVIPVKIGDTDGEPLRRSAWSEGGADAPPSPAEWEVQRSAVDLPRLQVDTSFRVGTRTYVERLAQDGREVKTHEYVETGPSRATALTEITLDSGAKAEVYQFDDPETLELWYRFLHQFHESLGWETSSQIEVQGMTLLRTDPNFGGETRQALADCSRTTLNH